MAHTQIKSYSVAISASTMAIVNANASPELKDSIARIKQGVGTYEDKRAVYNAASKTVNSQISVK